MPKRGRFIPKTTPNQGETAGLPPVFRAFSWPPLSEGQYQMWPLMWLYETWGLPTGEKWDKE